MNQGDNRLVYGFNSQIKAIVDPYLQFELMSYCPSIFPAPVWTWPSRLTYTRLLEAINSRFSASALSPPAFAAMAAPRSYLIVRGLVDFSTDQITFCPFSRIETANVPQAPPQGGYRLRALNAGGAILSEISFQPNRFVADFPAVDPAKGSFLIHVPFDPAIRGVVVLRDDVEVASKTASANPPVVTVRSPNGGENIDAGPVTLAWEANDADGDALTFVVKYSADAGATWETLNLDWPEQSLTIDSSALKASGAGVIRVLVSDGFHTAMDDSDGSFTVQNHAPDVALNPAWQTDRAIGNDRLILQANAYDPDDGPLGHGGLQWLSSIDGIIGFGTILDISATALSEGRHTITIVATDGAGSTNHASTEVLILRNPPPGLNALLAGAELWLSWPAYATNYVLQSADLLSAAWADVTNGVPGVLGTNRTVALPRDLPARFYRLEGRFR